MSGAREEGGDVAPSRQPRMRGDDRRRMTLETAARLFSERGYSRTTMDDIAAAAGIKKGTLYHFYPSKDALLAAVLRAAVLIPQARFDAVIAGDGSHVEKLRRLIAVLVESHDALLPLMVTYTRVSLDTISDPQGRAELVEIKRHFETTWENVVKAAIEHGELRADLDHKLVSFGIIGMINWMYKWYVPGGRKRPAEIARTFAAMVLEGLGVPPDATPQSRDGRR